MKRRALTDTDRRYLEAHAIEDDPVDTHRLAARLRLTWHQVAGWKARRFKSW